MTKFEGFGPGVQEWFEGLEADNTKAYFTAHRDFFEATNTYRVLHGSKIAAHGLYASISARGL